ncbi:M4 family metallopeptidase [Halotalea alkalilenta]|uniref:M4 family metallopeptidase n=1 Tax=Halotalea alkalilenta TaxID=376489 RepID=UPI0004854C0A|nr:M4 family metallopeptidase [Halotalea alkalilenta]
MSATSYRPGFIPPYLLSRIIDHGSVRQRSCASSTLVHVRSLLANPLPAQAPRRTGGTRAASMMLDRSIFDAQQRMELPGELVRAEGQPPSNQAAVDEAYDHLGITHRFFSQVLGRDSIDGDGMALLGTVHYGQDYQNAFWNGRQMVFGDGDGELFNRFTIALDVVAHELSHGVIEHEAALVYANQPGALNESIADVFGILAKQFHLGQSATESDWIIGAGLFTARIEGRGLRSMAEPGSAYDDPLVGRDPQPGHMREFVVTRDDNGGVHINSGIPNRAFQLAAVAIGGLAWETVGPVWYDTLCDRRLANDADFDAFARLTIEHAEGRFGAGSSEARAVDDAWRGVGVL